MLVIEYATTFRFCIINAVQQKNLKIKEWSENVNRVKLLCSLWMVIVWWCRDLRARLEVAIERVLELVKQVNEQKTASPSHERRSSVCDEVHYATVTTAAAAAAAIFVF